MEKDVTIKITIWNEGRHETLHPDVARIYPSGIHSAISAGLKNEGFAIRCGSLDDPDQGLGEQQLNGTDVLLWWGHIAHEEVGDALVDRVQQRVLKGMGLIVLHSGHHSKVFRRLMGTNCNLAGGHREIPIHR
jgi:trehalose utilization protein